MQNSAVRISFGIWHSVKLIIGWEMHKILLQESVSILYSSEIDKNEEEILEIQEFSKILSIV